MALEHNLIYYASRVKERRENSKIPQPQGETVINKVNETTIADLRELADLAGLPLSVVLKRIQDPDLIHSYLPERSLEAAIVPTTLNRFRSKIRDSVLEARGAGYATPMILKDYYPIIYSSFIRKITEIENLSSQAPGDTLDG